MHKMYFMDFIKAKERPSKRRYVLSGTNEFLMDIAIVILSVAWECPVIKRIKTKADLKFIKNALIFPSKTTYVVYESSIDILSDYTIKITKNKMTKKYKDAGFEEVVCGDLFPNQVEELTHIFVKGKLNEDVHMDLIRFICHCNNYDVASIVNTIELLSYSGRRVTEISLGELVLFCGDITNIESNDATNLFIEGKYVEFIQVLNQSRKIAKDILWALLAIVMKAQTASMTGKTWYEKRMAAFAGRMYHSGMHVIADYLNDLAKTHMLKTDQVFNRLCRLSLYLNGSIDKLR